MRDAEVVRLFDRELVADAHSLIHPLRAPHVQRLVRLARRATSMSAAEVAHRLAVRLTGYGEHRHRDRRPSALSADDAITCLRDRSPFAIGRGALHAALGDDGSARLLDAADVLCNDGVSIFGHMIALDPKTLDWTADPSTGQRFWPAIPLTEGTAVMHAATADVPADTIVDVKYTWELSRHQYLATLAHAELLRPGRGYADRISALLDGWIDQSGDRVGVNWSSSLEVGLRSIAWMWTLGIAADFATTAPGRDRWFAALARHYDHLRTHLSLFTDRSNHLIGEVAALWMMATVFPVLPGAQAERERCAAVLAIEVERQVTADGVTCEQATGYHCFVMDFLCQVLMVAARTGTVVPPVIAERTERMREFLDRVAGVGGELPQIGDNDDGRALPYPLTLSSRGRAEALIAASPDALRGGTPWWLGTLPRRSRATASTVFRRGGYAVLEGSTATGDRLQLVFDVGGMEFLPNAAHEHADALSILVRVNSTLALGDPGTGIYTGSSAIRNGFRGTRAHNTVTVDGLNQADALDAFKWINPFRAELLAWEQGDDADYAAAMHDGYTRLRQPVTHVREVLFIRPTFWLVVDRLFGAGAHDVTHTFHCPPDVRVTRDDADDAVDALASSGDGVRLMHWALHATAHLRTGAAPWSPGYGRWTTSPEIVITTRGLLPLVFVTLLVPVVAHHPSLQMTRPEDGAPLEERGVVRTLFDARDPVTGVRYVCGVTRGSHVVLRTLDGERRRARTLGTRPNAS